MVFSIFFRMKNYLVSRVLVSHLDIRCNPKVYVSTALCFRDTELKEDKREQQIALISFFKIILITCNLVSQYLLLYLNIIYYYYLSLIFTLLIYTYLFYIIFTTIIYHYLLLSVTSIMYYC